MGVVAICEEPGEVKIEEERRTEEGARKELSANGKTNAFNIEPVHLSFGLDRDRTEDRK